MSRLWTTSAAGSTKKAAWPLWTPLPSFRMKRCVCCKPVNHLKGQQGQALAKAFWAMVTEFTGGDTSLLPKLMEIGQFKDMDNAWQQKQALGNSYIEPALGAYFSRLGINHF